MGESIIFASEDINDCSEEDIVNNVKTSPLLKKDTQITFKRSEAGYVFVNFNFETD